MNKEYYFPDGVPSKWKKMESLESGGNNLYLWRTPGGASGKEPACQCRRCKRGRFSPWVGKIPCRRERLPTPVFWPGECHELYSPWGLKESDTTERLSPPLS